MPLDVMRPQPARQPEAVAAGLVGHGNARDRLAGGNRLIAPALQLRQRCNCASSAAGSGDSFFKGSRSMPDTIAASNQLD